MAVKIRDIQGLDTFSKIKLVAGEGGIDRIVNSAFLADLETGNAFEFDESIISDALVISGVRDGEITKGVKLIDGIKTLIALGSSGLIVNSKSVKKIYKEVIDYCEKNDYPLFELNSEDVGIENLLFDILMFLREDKINLSMERNIDLMIEKPLPRGRVLKLAEEVNPNFNRYCIASYIVARGVHSDFNPANLYNKLPEANNDDVEVSYLGYKKGLLVIVSLKEKDRGIHDRIVKSVLSLGRQRDHLMVATGEFHSTYEGLHTAIRECYYAFMAGVIEDLERVDYENIGTYKFLIPRKNDPEEIAFMESYIQKMNSEQLETAVAFVKSNGDIDKTAKRLICHKNTVRYRISKIQEKTDPHKTELQFYENLSAAIKLYLLNQ